MGKRSRALSNAACKSWGSTGSRSSQTKRNTLESWEEPVDGKIFAALSSVRQGGELLLFIRFSPKNG